MIGLLFVILAQVAYAVQAFAIRRYFAAYNPLLVTALLTVISAIFFFPIFFLFKSEWGGLDFKKLVPFIVVGVVSLTIGEIFLIWGFQKAPSSAAASLMAFFYPLFVTILGIFFLKEPLTIRTVIAGILMFLGFAILVIQK